MESKWSKTGTTLLWAVVLGGVGFVCGYAGPLFLGPDANQGPLLGIFFTGPGGFVGGLLLGLIVVALRRWIRLPGWIPLFSIAALWGALIIWYLAFEWD